ncbi:MAG: sulfite exporter TauE/SafE family protein [Pseudomonadales bacterium]|jgi:uncharacterized membrane protein YfcA|nr:sulfite exporter TauE/SafE family protein [Pseudomonadales bacterium]
MLPTAILITVLATSVLSGVLGMAGGMILMAVLTLLLPVPVAMMLHGVTQAGANGSRAFFLRAHVRWSVLPPYLLGVGACITFFAVFTLIPDRSVVLMLVGLFPWIGRVLPAIERLDVERRGPAFACGAIVTAAQLLAGASGPLLDIFFLRSRLSRHEIVATKAITQTLGHLTKLGYYGTLAFLPGDGLVLDGDAPAWLFVAVVPVALLGTRIGTRLLDRIEDAQFRYISERIILAIGAACTITGVTELVMR